MGLGIERMIGRPAAGIAVAAWPPAWPSEVALARRRVKVRFTDVTRSETYIAMTDGIPLAETQQDRFSISTASYSDEAHERR